MEKIEARNLGSKNFLQHFCHVWDNAENIVQPHRPQMTIWRMRISCWIT